MRLMESRYHKVVGLDLVLNWSRKKCGGPRSGPKMIHMAKKKKKKKKKTHKKKKQNKKTKKQQKTIVLITEIKNQGYHVILHLLLNV